MQNVSNEFEFTSFTLASDRKSILFRYKMTLAQANQDVFEEKLLLPIPIPLEVPDLLLNKMLFSLHLVLGISYYKMFSITNISIKSGELNKEQAVFWNTVYTKGLGEFFYKNNIDFRNLVKFPFQDYVSTSVVFERSDKSLLGIGGGKDSIVSYELLRKAKKSFVPLIIESNHSYPLIDRMLSNFQIQNMKLKRIIDKKIFETNTLGRVFNGHIPISAINAFIGVFSCLIYDYRYFIVSNERSANFGNVNYLGMEVNHQWSKSVEFESLFQLYVKQFITPSVIYFSFLRPLSELAIVKLFSSYKKYFSFFSSCNTNYTVNKVPSNEKWCKKCPKCAFVFCLLSAFLPKKIVVTIFGQNLFQDETMSTLYRQLWGVQDIKPFECVGIPEEVQIAFYLSYINGEYKNDLIMNLFEKEVLPLLNKPDILISNLLTKDGVNTIPEEFRSIISQIQL